MSINVDSLLQSVTSGMTVSTPSKIQTALTQMRYGKIAITIFLLVWAVTMSILIYRESNPPSSPSAYHSSSASASSSGESGGNSTYYQMHQVWFGNESIMMIVVRLWIYTMILLLFLPAIRDILLRAKVMGL
jgi:hypothetical protein